MCEESLRKAGMATETAKAERVTWEGRAMSLEAELAAAVAGWLDGEPPWAGPHRAWAGMVHLQRAKGREGPLEG